VPEPAPRHWLLGYLRGMTLPIIVAMVVLMGVSLLALRSAEAADASLTGYAFRQAVYVAVALVAFLVASLVPYLRLGRASYALFALNLALLVLVFFLRPIKGSHRWIDLKLFRLQPSELAKVTYILTLAWYLRYRENYVRLWGLIPPFVLTLIPAALILKEPDLGTTLLLFPTLFFMLLMAGARLRHLLTIAGVAVAVVLLPVPQRVDGLAGERLAERTAMAYGRVRLAGRTYALRAAPLLFMRGHQLRRVRGWLGYWLEDDPQRAREIASDEGFQLDQSLLILGSGGLTGKARTEAMRLHIKTLPHDHTDFIFAVIGGRWGLVGCMGVLLLYLAIFICGAEIAARTPEPFGRLLAVGVLALLFAQIFINVGMSVALLPITGMTLPLISYGGSSLVVNGLALGLLVSVGRHRPMLLGRKPFDHGARPQEDAADVSRPLPRVDWPRKRWGPFRRRRPPSR